MTNSDRIKKALQQLCWKEKHSTQSAYAEKVGLNQSYLSGIISGRKTRRLPLETMEKLFPDLVVLPLGLSSKVRARQARGAVAEAGSAVSR